jgi:hypothetical protein
MFRVLNVILGMLLATPAARASPYWIEYEPGNAHFPEEEGWTRHIAYGYGGAQRWFEDGALVIDSRASLGILDYYTISRPGAIDPAPGETFLLEWRLRIDEVVIDGVDLSVAIFADSKWAVGFGLGRASIRSVFEPAVSAPFSEGALHEFSLSSTDMRSYVLYIDGQEVIDGAFWLSLDSSEVGWGDDVQGNSSLSHWDYVRFGVVPEPGFSLWVLVPVVARRALRGWRGPRIRRNWHV